MNQWELIRLRCLRDHEPIARVAREVGVSENTVRKYLRTDKPPTKMVINRSAVLDQYQPIIDDYLKTVPKITSRRIGILLQERHGFHGRIGGSMLRRYIARRRERICPKETFLRIEYLPGDQVQFDFSPMRVIIAGVETIVQLFVMRLSYSGAFFARASYREDRPSLFAGILEALKYFGGVPKFGVFDNARTAVDKVLAGRERVENTEFQAFRGALAFEVHFAAPAKGNEKGGVEGTHGYIEDNFFRPIPSHHDMAELNASLIQFCTQDMQRIHSTHNEKIEARFLREIPTLRPLPEVLPRPVITHSMRINKFSEITIDTNRYSVPTKYAYRQATVEVSEATVRVLIDAAIVAEHQRSNLCQDSILNPLHYIDILQRKHRSASRAFVLAHGRVPDALQRLFQRLEDADKKSATKKWTTILALAKTHSLNEVADAAERAMARGCIDGEAIALMLRQKADHVPAIHLVQKHGPVGCSTDVNLDLYAMAGMVEAAC